MKMRLFSIAAALMAMTACTPTTTTTPPAGDSTATVQVDSPATVPPASVDSGTPAPDASGDPQGGIVTPDNGNSPADNTTNGKVKGTPDPIAATYRMTVSFTSMGGGIDFKAKSTFDKFVSTYEATNKVKLAHETVGWGREGEVDYCYKLAELKDPKKSDFVNQCKAQVKGKAQIELKENSTCRVPRK
jgi:hypothetical protein